MTENRKRRRLREDKPEEKRKKKTRIQSTVCMTTKKVSNDQIRSGERADESARLYF
jgi:hypothetical protein